MSSNSVQQTLREALRRKIAAEPAPPRSTSAADVISALQQWVAKHRSPHQPITPLPAHIQEGLVQTPGHNPRPGDSLHISGFSMSPLFAPRTGKFLGWTVDE